MNLVLESERLLFGPFAEMDLGVAVEILTASVALRGRKVTDRQSRATS